MAGLMVTLLAFTWKAAIQGAVLVILCGIPAYFIARWWDKLDTKEDEDDDWLTSTHRARLEKYAEELDWCVSQIQRANFTLMAGHDVLDAVAETVRGLWDYLEINMQREDIGNRIFRGIDLGRVNLETHRKVSEILWHAKTLLGNLKDRLK